MYICVCAVCAVSSIIDDANQTAIARPELVIFVHPLNHSHVICAVQCHLWDLCLTLVMSTPQSSFSERRMPLTER